MPVSEPRRVPTGRRPRRGDQVELNFECLDTLGRAYAELDGRVFGVRGAVPGSRAVVEVRGRRRGAIEGRILRVLEAGPLAREARCPHFGTCGGCTFQTLDYARQLQELRTGLERTLLESGCLGDVQVEPVLGMDCPWAYRNKMDFTFASRRWIEPHEPQGVDASFALGLHVTGQYQKVLDIHSCAIHFEGADALLNSVRELSRQLDLAPWDLKSHQGLLRHLVLRKGVRTGEVMVYLVTSSGAETGVDELAQALLARHPEVTTIVQGVSTRRATVALGEHERVLHGSGVIHDELCGVRFKISPGSFFQTNTVQAERLFEIVAEESAATDGPIHDLYCGAGAIGLTLARGGRPVVGFESVAAAVQDARANAALNGVEHATFVEGDVVESLEQRGASLPLPGLLVVDPPRAGLHPRLPPALAVLGAPRLVYVSCNPASAARDLVHLRGGGYHLVRVRPVDMFPHTPHLECVLTLDRKA